MNLRLPIATAALAALLLGGCYTARTYSSVEGAYGHRAEARYGQVQQVRETVRQYRGDPGGGAVAGAIIGGLLGGGRHGGAGAVAGAITGAMIGANASQGYAEERYYEVVVRFEDGSIQAFTYRGGTPFRVGDEVLLGPRGLERG